MNNIVFTDGQIANLSLLRSSQKWPHCSPALKFSILRSLQSCLAALFRVLNLSGSRQKLRWLSFEPFDRAQKSLLE
jgi:hypothetical protein